MEIWHRVSFGDYDQVDEFIESLNIKILKSPLPGGFYGIHIDIEESDPRWPKISELLELKKNAGNMYDTIFTDSEILDAEWVRLMPVFERGYPQPKKPWGQINFENECPKCLAGYRQKAPFRLKGEPRLGKNDFLQLYWTFTLFCTQKVLKVLQENKIKGYEVWPAIIHKINQPSNIVSQLVFPHVAAPALADEDKLRPEICPVCGITTYAYHKRGYMHLQRESLAKDVDCQLTYEWFGTGFREFLVSHSFAKLIIDNKWRGVRLKPVKLI